MSFLDINSSSLNELLPIKRKLKTIQGYQQTKIERDLQLFIKDYDMSLEYDIQNGEAIFHLKFIFDEKDKKNLKNNLFASCLDSLTLKCTKDDYELTFENFTNKNFPKEKTIEDHGLNETKRTILTLDYEQKKRNDIFQNFISQQILRMPKNSVSDYNSLIAFNLSDIIKIYLDLYYRFILAQKCVDGINNEEELKEHYNTKISLIKKNDLFYNNHIVITEKQLQNKNGKQSINSKNNKNNNLNTINNNNNQQENGVLSTIKRGWNRFWGTISDTFKSITNSDCCNKCLCDVDDREVDLSQQQFIRNG